MKNFTLTLFFIVLIIGPSLAQENKTITEVKTVKRIVTKEGSKVTVQEVETIEGQKGAVVVADDEEENQVFAEKSDTINQKNVLVDETNVDENNEALIAERKRQQEEELKKSKEEAMARAAAQKKLLAQKEKERQEALKANRKRLERRGKGVGKLDRKKRN
ncbi:hypothetical protein POV27_08040 [Aureisphaera galaxeae]|uniref:hypothetical protein n=1 Tax=Aureisphaera galaxeae TaxID=1538023 RepID=UPI002350F9B0|nr:hypothetical protein [Aureisphaera galaxeae]MDC8003999.1 hypothetical protein [Aureisphaera galaxeae]